MGVQISWNTYVWGYSPDAIRSVNGLSVSTSVDVERNEEKDGQSATQTVALALATLSFSYDAVASAGVNPRSEYEYISSCIGIHAPLYMNGKRFVCKEMMLKSVDASDWILDAKGRAISVKISLKFEEYAEEASGLKKQKTVKASALRPGIKKNVGATSALSVGPTATKKMKLAPKNSQMARW